MISVQTYVSILGYENSQFGSHVQYDPRPLNNTLFSIAGGQQLAREKLNTDRHSKDWQ